MMDKHTYLQGLLSPVERKNTWQLAEAVGESTPYAFQNLLGRGRWDADAVRDDLRDYVREHLGDPSGVLVLDETGFLKKGEHSAGVQRQYSGTAGRIENCQIGVFLAYVAPRGRTFIDRALYLPESWIKDRPRCDDAGIPADVVFATKPALGLQMVERALDGGIKAAWVSGDEVYGEDGKLRRALEERRQPYVLAISCQFRIWKDDEQVRVDELVKQFPNERWQRISAGDGMKGPRWYDWAYERFEEAQPSEWQRGILFRRSLAEPEKIEFFAVFAPEAVTLETIVRAAGKRWGVEECIESAKGEVGLDQYEVRNWAGWHRHITLALFAHAFLTVQRAASDEVMPPKKKPHAARARRGSAAFAATVDAAARAFLDRVHAAERSFAEAVDAAARAFLDRVHAAERSHRDPDDVAHGAPADPGDLAGASTDPADRPRSSSPPLVAEVERAG
jgi:SRSO17 transposase